MILKPRQDVLASLLNNWEDEVVEFKSGESYLDDDYKEACEMLEERRVQS